MPELSPLHPVCRTHLDELSDEIGLFQHAVANRPDPRHGYCTDDVARALTVDLLHMRELGWELVAASAERAVRFLAAAFDPTERRFRNFRRGDGSWIHEQGSEDAHARALLALGEAVVALPAGRLREQAEDLFEAALPAALALKHLRPRAAAVIACAAAGRGGPGPAASTVGRSLADTLRTVWAPVRPDDEWPWPEPVVTYENGLLPRAMIAGGVALDRPEMVDRGLAMLDWLLERQVDGAGRLAPVGNRGWWPRGGIPARFDQQPIEATSLLLAAAAAHEATGEQRYADAAEAAYAWYLGANDLGVPVAEPDRGASFDGLTPSGVNANQGAESTLMWLVALEVTRRRRAGDVGREPAGATRGAAL